MDIPEYVPGHGLLAGRIVVVTAAAGAGIGYAVAKKAVEEGATVVISDVHERRLDEAADLLAEMAGVRPVTVVCDVRDEAQVQALLDTALAEHGRIDVMVNNAGLGGDTSLVEMTDEEWDRVLDITLTGSMRCTRASMRIMGVQGHGVIVNNASVLGWRAQAGQSHYAAAKAGVMALTRCAAIEGVESGIRINCVAPSFATHPFLARTSSEELLARLAAGEAYGRGAEPWEVANVVVFLASDYSSYMTGEVVSVSSQRA
ncbi:MAG: SDR family oxidoreductase [Actinomycetota bacterium]|nr:SDR family oxidoreductase [Actinomycetota bacterium]